MALRFTGFAVAVALLLANGCATSGPISPSLDAAYEPEGEPDISLDDYVLAFSEEFDSLNVSGRRCDTKWIAHTPWNGDFGAARFADPSRGFPFLARDGLLRIEARKTPDAGWLAGLLSSYNTCGEGFAQKFGYFEARIKLPEGDGFWPAFWLIGKDRSAVTAEIDVFENHTVRPDKLVSTVRTQPHTEGVEPHHVHSTHTTPLGALSRGFNTIGVSVEEDETVFYFNRREYWRTPTPLEFHQPLFMLINLAMAGHEISPETPEQAFMYVDYVRAYTRR